jgi:hypothetical protein
MWLKGSYENLLQRKRRKAEDYNMGKMINNRKVILDCFVLSHGSVLWEKEMVLKFQVKECIELQYWTFTYHNYTCPSNRNVMLGANIVTFAASIVLGLSYMGLGNNFGYECLSKMLNFSMLWIPPPSWCVAAVALFLWKQEFWFWLNCHGWTSDKKSH